MKNHNKSIHSNCFHHHKIPEQFHPFPWSLHKGAVEPELVAGHSLVVFLASFTGLLLCDICCCNILTRREAWNVSRRRYRRKKPCLLHDSFKIIIQLIPYIIHGSINKMIPMPFQNISMTTPTYFYDNSVIIPKYFQGSSIIPNYVKQ